MTDADDAPWPDPGAAKRAEALLPQARAAGLRFDTYLPPVLAEWLLARIARGTFEGPSEAVFVLLGEARELEPHADLRTESLRRRLQAAMDDPRPSISAEQVMAELRALAHALRLEPAVWPRHVEPKD